MDVLGCLSFPSSLPRLPASHKRCKVAWFGDAGGSETIETIPNIILQASRIDLLFALPSESILQVKRWSFLGYFLSTQFHLSALVSSNFCLTSYFRFTVDSIPRNSSCASIQTLQPTCSGWSGVYETRNPDHTTENTGCVWMDKTFRGTTVSLNLR